MKRYFVWPAVTGVTFALAGIVVRKSIGSVSGEGDAVRLIEPPSSAGLYLGSAVAMASATILALMLALLGLTKRVDRNFDFSVSTRIQIISPLAAATVLTSLLFLLLLAMPVGQIDQVPERWFPMLYNVLFALVIGMSALSAHTVVMPLIAIRRVARGPFDDHDG